MNLQFLWVLTGAEGKQADTMPLKRLFLDKLENKDIGCVRGEPLPELCGVHRMGAAAGKRVTASSCAGGLCPIQVSGADCGW